MCIYVYTGSYNISSEDLFDSKDAYVSVKIVFRVKFCSWRRGKRKTDTEACARVLSRFAQLHFISKRKLQRDAPSIPRPMKLCSTVVIIDDGIALTRSLVCK